MGRIHRLLHLRGSAADEVRGISEADCSVCFRHLFFMKLLSSTSWLALVAGLVVATVFAADTNLDIPLKEITTSKRGIDDPAYGISLTYPTGWTVVRAFRWGPNHEK